MKKKTIVLFVSFLMWFGSGVTLFIFSRQNSVEDYNYLLSPAGNAHTVFALITSILVILHIKGNIKIKKEYEDRIKNLQEEHKSELERLNKVN